MAKSVKEEREDGRSFSLLGISMTMASTTDRNIPLHWHDTLELLYCLNGNIEVTIEKKKYQVSARQLIVIDSGKVHRIRSKSPVFMFTLVEIQKKKLISYIPNIDFYRISCTPVALEDERFESYLQLCRMAETLTRLEFDHAATSMKSDGIALLMLSELLEHFSTRQEAAEVGLPAASVQNIGKVIQFVQERYKGEISLKEAADLLGYTKEYFCTYFKRYMGLSFLNYLNEVRVTAAYRELLATDLPVSEVMEHNGITNQKIFNRTFREIYGCTPREARKKI